MNNQPRANILYLTDRWRLAMEPEALIQIEDMDTDTRVNVPLSVFRDMADRVYRAHDWQVPVK